MTKKTNPNPLQITSITYRSDYLILHCSADWYQEDIDKLYISLTAQVVDICIQDKIQGADRESIRFSWQSYYYFVVHFEFYSQSSWIEAADEVSINKLSDLQKALVLVNPRVR